MIINENKPFSYIYNNSNNAFLFNGNCSDYLETLTLHPYLGFTHNRDCSGKGYDINTFGMLGKEYDRDKFNIGIFGGSVAAQFSGLSKESKNYLEKKLNCCYTNIKQKPFNVLNFSDGAWKQPNQVVALTLFGDYIDAAISIEGYNEHYYMNNKTNIDITQPARNFTYLKNSKIFERIYLKLKYFDFFPVNKSNFLKLFTHLFRKILEAKQNLQFAQEKDYEQIYSNEISNEIRYQNFIKLFDQIAIAKSIYSLIIVQPVPLYKPLSELETSVVGDLNYKKEYDKVTKIIGESRNSIDLSRLYENENNTVFIDHIHLNDIGNDAMATELINRLIEDKIIYTRN